MNIFHVHFFPLLKNQLSILLLLSIINGKSNLNNVECLGDVALDGGEAGHTLLDIAQRDGAFAHIVDGAGYVVATRAYALFADFGELG